MLMPMGRRPAIAVPIPRLDDGVGQSSGVIRGRWRTRLLADEGAVRCTDEVLGERSEGSPPPIIDQCAHAHGSMRFVVPEGLDFNAVALSRSTDALERLLLVEQALDELLVGRQTKLGKLCTRDRPGLVLGPFRQSSGACRSGDIPGRSPTAVVPGEGNGHTGAMPLQLSPRTLAIAGFAAHAFSSNRLDPSPALAEGRTNQARADDQEAPRNCRDLPQRRRSGLIPADLSRN